MANPADPDITKLVLQPSIELAIEFLLEIVSPPAQELGELLADQVRSWRFKNQIKILNKAKDKLKESGISPGKVPLKILVPLLDSGSLEEEESMTDRWANLLANAANPNLANDVKAAYIEVLKQLTPRDTLVLDRLYDYYNEQLTEGKRRRAKPSPIELDAAKLKEICGIEQEAFERAMDNLMRLNLITTPGALLVNAQLEEQFFSEPGAVQLQFARFGYDFVKVCRI